MIEKLNPNSTNNTDSSYESKMNDEVIPYFNQGTQNFFEGLGGIQICYHEIIRGSKNAIVMLPGRTEPFLKYSELVFDLDELGHDFYLMDHRGQGQSGRMLADGHKGYVKNFDNYIEDLETFINIKELKIRYENIYLIAHSMGAAIALWHQIKKGKTFSKMVLSAPMLEIITGANSPRLVENYMNVLRLIGNGTEYSSGSGKGDVNTPFKNNRVTRCLERFQMARNLERKNTDLIMGGTTNQWVLESLRIGHKIYKNKHKLKEMPILIFQAGKDLYSEVTRQNRICESLDTCRKIFMPTSYHEMFQERDSIRNRIVDETISFLREK